MATEESTSPDSSKSAPEQLLDSVENSISKGTKHLIVAGLILGAVVTGIYIAWTNSQLYTFDTGFALANQYDMLFDTATWAFPAAASVGLIGGGIASLASRPHSVTATKIERHKPFGTFLEHWVMAAGLVLFVISYFALGFLMFPRLVTSTESVGFAINLHFIGGVFIAFAASYHVASVIMGSRQFLFPTISDLKMIPADLKSTLHSSDQPPATGQYRPMQKAVYSIWAVTLAIVSIAAGIRIFPYIIGSGPIYGTAVTAQGILTLIITVLLIGHIAYYTLIPSNRPLLMSMLTGWLPREYAEKYHDNWTKQLDQKQDQ